MLNRLDAELVRRKLARSREHAQELVEAGQVFVDGVVSSKSSRQVSNEISIVVKNLESKQYVSRGAYKLLSALSAFASYGLDISGRQVLDAGASTGGFTQVCLEKGAAKVIAVDVGYGQLAWELRQNPRVEVIERTNIRYMEPESLSCIPNFVVADLSFISLKTVLPALKKVCTKDVEMLLMVKPQFEVGKTDIGEGVVSDPNLRASAVINVVESAQNLDLALKGVVASGLPGPSGNVEYFVWLVSGGVCKDKPTVEQMVETAVKEGPQ